MRSCREAKRDGAGGQWGLEDVHASQLRDGAVIGVRYRTDRNLGASQHRVANCDGAAELGRRVDLWGSRKYSSEEAPVHPCHAQGCVFWKPDSRLMQELKS